MKEGFDIEIVLKYAMCKAIFYKTAFTNTSMSKEKGLSGVVFCFVCLEKL